MRFKLTILFTALILFSSCNPAKQILKNQDQFEQVGKAWEKLHPCVNDSSVKILPGRIDSVPVPVPVVDSSLLKTVVDSVTVALAKKYQRNIEDCNRQVNEAFYVGYQQAHDEWNKVKVPIKQPDTIKTTVRDIRREQSLQGEVDKLKTDLSEAKDKASKFKDQRNYAYMGLGILLLIGIVIAIIKIKL